MQLPLKTITPLLIVLSLAGCAAPQPTVNRPAASPINSIRVGSFKCDDDVTGQAVRNVFVEMLSRYADVKVVKDGEADVTVEGTVTHSHGGSASGSASVIGSSGEAVGGSYISGVTSLATRNGEIITSASWGQILEKGAKLLPPEGVARRAADRLLSSLAREGLKRR